MIESENPTITLAENSLPFYTRGEEGSAQNMFRSMMGSIPPGGIHGAEV
jgi:hypothetical protein